MARKFRFRLETVRRLREQARDARRRVVSENVRAVTGAEQHRAELVRARRDRMQEMRLVQQTGRLDAVSIRRHFVHAGYLEHQLDVSETELTKRRGELRAEQDRLAEASKRLRVIEKLHERQWRRYLADVAREEQAALDEAAVQPYTRRPTPDGGELTW